MSISTATVSVITLGRDAQRERGPGPQRLWSSLVARWTQRLDERIEAELHWLGHAGVLEDFRIASRG